MTHHHEPFEQERAAAPTAPSPAHAHRQLWIAVAVTMAVIVALWVLLLPSIFSGRGFLAKEMERYRAISDDGTSERFRESVDGFGAALEGASAAIQARAEAEAKAEQDAQEAAAADASVEAGVTDLQERIEAAEPPAEQH
jgi:hypothetical protein